MRITTFAAALLLSTIAAAPAFAQTGDTVVRRVQVSDLDLSTAGGQAALRYRIGRAIEGVCGSYATVETSGQVAIDTCRRQAQVGFDRAVAARRAPLAVASAR